MSTVSQFDTQTVRVWNKPQPDTFAQVNFSPPFVTPRLPRIRQLDVDKSAHIRVETMTENITQTSGGYHITSWADTKHHPDTFARLDFPPPFTATPRLSHGIRQLDVDKSATIDVKTTLENITSWADAKRHPGAFAQLNFPPPFTATPRFPHGIRHLDVDKSANVDVKTTIENITSWANNKAHPDTFAQLDFPPPFAATPCLPHGIRQLDVDESANVRVKTTTENIIQTPSASDTFAQVKFSRPFTAPPRLPHGIRQLDVDKSANIRVKATIEDITQTSGVYHITSWADTTLYSGTVDSLNVAPANLEFLTGEHIRDLSAHPKAAASTRIPFERPFLTPPKVLVFFNLIDLDNNHNWRLKTTATDIDADGFTLNIETWGDTILYAAQACWIAYPEDRAHIFSTSVNTEEVRPWDMPQLQQSKSIGFGDVEFWKNPNVFVAWNLFDLACGANFRLKAYVNNVTQKGLTWHIDTWADTVLHTAGATIIAVN